MGYRPGSLIIGLVALAALSGLAPPSDPAPQASDPSSQFEIGKAFPTVAFPSLHDGRPISLADFRGRKVLLQIFASW